MKHSPIFLIAGQRVESLHKGSPPGRGRRTGTGAGSSGRRKQERGERNGNGGWVTFLSKTPTYRRKRSLLATCKNQEKV